MLTVHPTEPNFLLTGNLSGMGVWWLLHAAGCCTVQRQPNRSNKRKRCKYTYIPEYSWKVLFCYIIFEDCQNRCIEKEPFCLFWVFGVQEMVIPSLHKLAQDLVGCHRARGQLAVNSG